MSEENRHILLSNLFILRANFYEEVRFGADVDNEFESVFSERIYVLSAVSY